MEASEIVRRKGALEGVRKNLDTLLQEVENYVTPYRGEFFKPMTSTLEVEWHRSAVYDSTAVVECANLASNIHSAMSDPSSKWFEMAFANKELNDNHEAKKWLDECDLLVYNALMTESDFNTEISESYIDDSSFGTSFLMMEEKDEMEWDGLDFTAWPIQDSYFEEGPDGLPFNAYRVIRYTLLQLREKFGKDALPNDLQNRFEGEDVDRKYDVIFCIYHRQNWQDIDITKPLEPKNRPIGFKYVIEADAHTLQEGGYYRFPMKVTRWRKTAGASWGHSPAMLAIADIKQLNDTAAQVSEAREKAIDPPSWTTDRGIVGDYDVTPGGLTVSKSPYGDGWGTIPSFAGFQEAEAEIARLQQSIKDYFYSDLFNLKESPAMTATEVIERTRRSMRLLAPSAGRIQKDKLVPIVEDTFWIMMRQGQLPEMPEVVSEANLDIRMTGPLAKAVQGDMARAVDEWIAMMFNASQFVPSVLDNIDTDEWARTQADRRGVPASMLASEEEIAETRTQRAEQEQAMQEIAMMQAGGEAMGAAAEGQEKLRAVE